MEESVNNSELKTESFPKETSNKKRYSKKKIVIIILILVLISLSVVALSYHPSTEKCETSDPKIIDSNGGTKAYQVTCTLHKKGQLAQFGSLGPVWKDKSVRSYAIEQGTKINSQFIEGKIMYVFGEYFVTQYFDKKELYELKGDKFILKQDVSAWGAPFRYNEGLVYYWDAEGKFKTYSIEEGQSILLLDFSHVERDDIYSRIYDPTLFQDNEGNHYLSFSIVYPNEERGSVLFDISNQETNIELTHFNNLGRFTNGLNLNEIGTPIIGAIDTPFNADTLTSFKAKDFELSYGFNAFFDLSDILRFRWPY